MEVKFTSSLRGCILETENYGHSSRGDGISEVVWMMYVVSKLEVQTYLRLIYQINTDGKKITETYCTDDVENKFEEETKRPVKIF